MSVRTFFTFSTGLSKPVKVPLGTTDRFLNHVAEIEETFGFEVTQYKDNPPRWKSTEIPDHVPDDKACDLVAMHNYLVIDLYKDMATFGQKKQSVIKAEVITPAKAKTFWQALVLLQLPPSRWTDDYYRDRMDAAYRVMRGDETEGVSFDAPALTPQQAGAVIRLFDEYLDPGDSRLEVCEGEDHLRSSDDYYWCRHCGAIASDAAYSKASTCHRKATGECDLVNEYADCLGLSDDDNDDDESGFLA